MENTSKVSIVLPTFNGSAYIHQSIESCLKQTYSNLELVVVNDGSTDDTLEKIRAFQDERIKLINLEKNQGHIAALNQGFSTATGDLLTWTSDDNYYAPHALVVMVEELNEHSKVDFVYSRYEIVDQKGQKIRMGKTENPDSLDVDNCIGGCFLYRRKVYETIGDFDPDAFLAEDYEYWLRVREKFRMKKLDAMLYFYRAHEASLTGVHKEDKVQQQVTCIRERYVPKWRRILGRLKEMVKA